MREGDVVRGCFATADAVLVDHHSVVVAVQGAMVLLVYTTSIKVTEAAVPRRWSEEFSTQDCALAGWKNRCRYDVSRLALVPTHKVEVRGRVTTSTLQQLQAQVAQCSRRGEAEVRRYRAELPEQVTGQVSRNKREDGFPGHTSRQVRDYALA